MQISDHCKKIDKLQGSVRNAKEKMQWAANYLHDVTKESKTADEFARAMDTFRDILQEASEFCDDEVN